MTRCGVCSSVPIRHSTTSLRLQRIGWSSRLTRWISTYNNPVDHQGKSAILGWCLYSLGRLPQLFKMSDNQRTHTHTHCAECWYCKRWIGCRFRENQQKSSSQLDSDQHAFQIPTFMTWFAVTKDRFYTETTKWGFLDDRPRNQTYKQIKDQNYPELHKPYYRYGTEVESRASSMGCQPWRAHCRWHAAFYQSTSIPSVWIGVLTSFKLSGFNLYLVKHQGLRE